jgi:hypothetical protein
MTTLFNEDLYNQDTGLLKEPSSEPSGVGLSSPEPQKPLNMQQAESPGAIGHVQRALYGYSSKDVQANRQQQIDREEKRRELATTISAIENGVQLVQGLEGAERENAVNVYGEQLERVYPGMRDTFKAIAAQPSLLTSFEKYMPHLPEPIRQLMNLNPIAALKFFGTAEGVKTLKDAADKPLLKTADMKLRTLVGGWQQVVPPEMKELAKDGLTSSDIMAVQGSLPEPLRFTPDELDVIKRNDKMVFLGSGVMTGEGENQVMVSRAKRKDEAGKAPAHLDVDGKRYLFDPEKKLPGQRLATDPRYSLAGSAKSPADAGKEFGDAFNREAKLRDDYRADTKSFASRRPLFDSATDYMANRLNSDGTAKDRTSAGDAALAFAYAKMRDPNDRLAISETRDLVKLGNLPERFTAAVAAVVERGETLPDRVAKDMYTELKRAFGEQNKQQLKIEGNYERLAKEAKGKSENVVIRYAIPNLGGGAKTKVGEVVSRGGKQWKVLGHDKDGEPLVEEVRGRSP